MIYTKADIRHQCDGIIHPVLKNRIKKGKRKFSVADGVDIARKRKGFVSAVPKAYRDSHYQLANVVFDSMRRYKDIRATGGRVPIDRPDFRWPTCAEFKVLRSNQRKG